jgi:hypothetical protein
MTAIETTPTEPETQPEPDPIEVVYQGECPSLSERSTITYAVGRHPDGSLHLRLVANSGGGMFCDEWIPGSDIDAVVVGHTELTSTSLQVLKPGRSTNTAGFVMAAIKSLGLIRNNAENTRLHEHVPTETLEKVVIARMGQARGARRKKDA